LNLEKTLEDETVQLVRNAVIELTDDVKEALARALERETSEIGKLQLQAIVDNIKLAEESQVPICQDTGLILFFVKIGRGFPGGLDVKTALFRATRRATEEIPLRPNAVNPLTRENSGDNTGVEIPHIRCEQVEGDYIEVTVLPKGAGSENMSAFAMLNPSQGSSTVKKFVVDTVIAAGGRSCPPILVGVGLGGSADGALYQAKKAILRPIGSHHGEKLMADLEDELLKALNMSGIGPMGLGGNSTALGVNVEYSYCHTASLPVGVNLQCWAARKATMRMFGDGSVEHLTHRG